MVAVACLLALTAVCHGRVLFRGETFGFRDASQYYYPLHQRIQREWDAGRLPLWLPDENAGAPLLANPTAAVLYPGKIVFAVLPYRWAARSYGVLHTLLAAVAMIALGRGLGLSGIAAALAGLSYAFGASVLALCSNVIFLVGAAWLPLGLWAVDAVLRRGRRRAAVVLGAVLALMVLGGDPEAAYLCVVAGGLYAAVMLPALGGVRWWSGTPGDAPPALSPRGLTARLGALALGVVLGLGLAAVQILPTAELVGVSARSSGTMGDPYRYSVEPIRLIELVWPNVTGAVLPENHSWLVAIQGRGGGGQQQFWTPSLYHGGWTIVLAMVGASVIGGHPARRWLTLLAVLALAASLGQRGRVYPAMAAALPGFSAFRYPAKLMVLAALALSALAGFGWDRLTAGATRRGIVAACVLVSLSLAAWSGINMRRGWIIAALAEAPQADSLAGPLDAAAAIADAESALIHGALLGAAAAGLVLTAARRPRLAGALACLVMTLDLAAANAGLVWTVPQAVLDAPPEVARQIREAEGDDPSPGPFRVFRLPSAWYPDRFLATRSPDRLRELVAWERDSLLPSHSLTTGLASTFSPGVIDLTEYLAFFRPMNVRADAEMAEALGIRPGKRVVLTPRRGVDLWGSRYLVLPSRDDPSDPQRSAAAFVRDVEPIAAGADWRLIRNETAFPRAWLVHEARIVPPVPSGDLPGLSRAMLRLLLPEGPSAGAASPFDPRTAAVVETDDPELLAGYLPRVPPTAAERVAVVSAAPDRIELTATAERPGLLVLADTFYPGWVAEVDGQPAAILRANRLMRGVTLREGPHRVVFRYRPLSVRAGGAVSLLAGLAALALLARWRRLGPAGGSGDDHRLTGDERAGRARR